MRVDGKQIYENFKQGNTGGLNDAADGVKELQDAYTKRGESIKALQQRMSSAWTGDAADAANAGAGPLEKAYWDSSEPLDATRFSVKEQAASFDASGHAVVVVPDKPDKPSPWSTGLKAAIPIAGPFMAANDVKNYQEGMARYNEANETNVRVMGQYNDVTDTTRATLPTQYGTLEADGAEVSMNKPQPPIIEHHIWPPPVKPEKKPTKTTEENEQNTKNTENTETTGFVKPGTDDHKQPPDIGNRPPVPPDDKVGSGVIGGKGRDTTGSDDGTTKTGVKPGTGFPRTPTVPPRTPVGETPGGDESLIGMPGLSGGGGQGPYGGNSFGEPGGSGAGRGPGSAGGRLLDSSGRPGVGGMGAEGEGRLGGGQRSGMGGLGNAAAQEAAAARAAGGRGGQMGPMGAGGRQGEREDDDEHQRPDYLIEADPDAIFGTDQRTSPPVIGE